MRKYLEPVAAPSEQEVQEVWLADIREMLATVSPVAGAVPTNPTQDNAESERWEVGHTYGLSADVVASAVASARVSVPLQATQIGLPDMSNPMGSEGSENEPVFPPSDSPRFERAAPVASSAQVAPAVPVPTPRAGSPSDGGGGPPNDGGGVSNGGEFVPPDDGGPTHTYYKQVNGAICKVDKLSTNFWGWITGATKFKTKRYVVKEAALLTATYQGVDEMEDEHLKVDAVVSVGESIKQAACSTLCKPLKHSVMHRSANRFSKRVRIIKALVNAVKFKAPTEFTTSDADKRCLRLALIGKIEEAIEKGVRLHDEDPGEAMGDRLRFPYHQVKVRADEAAFYLKACKTAYYMKDGDEEFWEALVPKVLTPAK